MANNRLYIQDEETGETFMLAKAFSSGWQLFTLEDESSESWMDRLGAWLEEHDAEASYGNIATSTRLKLVAEGDLPDA